MVATRRQPAAKAGASNGDGPSTSAPAARGNSKQPSRQQQEQQLQQKQRATRQRRGGNRGDGGDGNGGLGGGDAAASAAASAGLDAFRSQHQLRDALAGLLKGVQDPHALLTPNESISTAARQAAQALYRYSVRQLLRGCSRGEAKALQSGSEPLLPELMAGQGFDAEQVWMQLELSSGAALRRTRKLVSRAFGSGTDGPASLIKPEYARHIDAMLREAEGGSGSDSDVVESDGGEGAGASDDAGSSGDADAASEDDDGGEDVDSRDDDSDGGDKAAHADARKQAAAAARRGGKQGAPSPGRGGGGSGGVEDRFMRLDEMEKFLEDAEAAAADGDAGGFDLEDEGEDSGSGSDEREDDRLLGLGGDDDDDSGGNDDDDDLEDLMRHTAKRAGGGNSGGVGTGKAGRRDAAQRGLMYNDFFGPDGEGDGVSDEGGEEEFNDGGDDDPSSEEPGDEQPGPHGLVGVGGGGGAEVGGNDDGSGGEGGRGDLSTHERRLMRLQERISELESSALAEKEWQLRGEADARTRPLNSALEVDLDFDTTVRAAPAVTAEVTQDIEDLIRKRIAEQRFDDVVRIVPPPLERTKRSVELDDTKSKKGLAEEYADEYVKATVGGAAPDKEEQVRNEAKALFSALVSKLDALSHFHYAPKPVVEELAVRSDVAAVLMEEAAPVMASAASMRTAAEAFDPAKEDGGSGGRRSRRKRGAVPVADAELSREDRKRRRAAGKRGRRAEVDRKEAEARAKAVAEGGVAPISGRKSDAAAVLAKAGKRARLLDAGSGRADYGKSAAVFAQIQASADAAKAGVKLKAPPKTDVGASGASLRL